MKKHRCWAFRMVQLPKIIRNIVLILTATSVCILLSILYANNKPFSKVYHLFNSKNDVFKLAKQLNSERLFKAHQYLDGLNKTQQPNYDSRPELAIVIVTVKRKAYDASSLGYVLQSISATHKLFVNDLVFPKKTMMICNVDLHPENYTEIVNLKPFIPVVERYGASSLPITINSSRISMYAKRRYNSKYDKETVDYMYCLESAYSLGASYVLLIEDDALPREDTLKVLKNKILYIKSKNKGRYSFIKLYYPQRWQGYAYESSRILEIISVGCVGAGLAVAIQFITCRTKSYFLQVMYFSCGAWLFVTAALIIGRQNVFEFYRISKYLYSLRNSPGCCTQAMLYTRQFIPALIDFLSVKHKALHTDLAIYNFTNVTGIPAYQIEPNLFYHVGMYTSLSSSDKHKNAEEFIFNP